MAAHLAAIRALGDDLAVGVTVFVEGEEEIGSPTFAASWSSTGTGWRPT